MSEEKKTVPTPPQGTPGNAHVPPVTEAPPGQRDEKTTHGDHSQRVHQTPRGEQGRRDQKR